MSTEPIPLRYIDVTVPNGGTVQLTLFPLDTVTVVNDPARLVVQFHEKSEETCTVFLGPGLIVRESTGLQYPVPVDETGQPRQFKSVEEYRAFMAERAAR